MPRPAPSPAPPAAPVGLFAELYWGTHLSEAWSVPAEVTRVHAAPDETAHVPLYNFPLPEEPFVLAELGPGGYRVHVPPGVRASVRERHAWRELTAAELGEARTLALPEGVTLRLSAGELHLHLAPSLARNRERRNRVRELTGLGLALALGLAGPVGFFLVGTGDDSRASVTRGMLERAREKDAEERSAAGLAPGPSPRAPAAPDAGPPAEAEGPRPLPARVRTF